MALAALAVGPWLLRNYGLSGHAFGLVLYGLLGDTYLFPGDALTRSIAPDLPDAITTTYAIQLKVMANLRAFFTQGFGFTGVSAR